MKLSHFHMYRFCWHYHKGDGYLFIIEVKYACENIFKYTACIYYPVLEFKLVKYVYPYIPVYMWVTATGWPHTGLHSPIEPYQGHTESNNSHQQNKSPALSALWWKASLHWEIVQFSKQMKEVNAVISAARGLISIYRFK